jgi:multidrug efflux pump subunit AcrA (membrane-fusion protein)
VTEEVRRGNLTLNVSANGTLQPTRSVNIGSELSGTVQQRAGGRERPVKKGQVLVELDTAKLDAQVLRSRASLAAAQARLAQAAATTKEAQASLAGWKRWRACRAARCRRPPSLTAAVPRWTAPMPTRPVPAPSWTTPGGALHR